MLKVNYSKLSDEQLLKKEKENNGLVLLSVVTVLSLAYYLFSEYRSEGDLNYFLVSVLITAIIGSIQVANRVQKVREEKMTRGIKK